MRDLNFGKDLIRKKIPLVSNSPGVYRMLGKKKPSSLCWQSKKSTSSPKRLCFGKKPSDKN